MEFGEMYNLLADIVGVSEDALNLAFAISGYSKETAEKILYYYTGWHSFSGWLSELEEEEE